MFVVTLLRVIVFCVAIASLFIMLSSFVRERKNWNEKTRDYWYSRVMWMIYAISATVEATIRHTPWRYSFIILCAASFATLKGNLQKGKWGGDRE